MAWIEVHQALPTHRKTLALADMLGVDPAVAVGHLVCLWLWALDNAPQGDLSRVGERSIARVSGWRKKPEVFVEALRSAGFLDDLTIHDWHVYVGRLMQQREHHSERAKRNKALYGDYSTVHLVRERDGDCCRYCASEVDWKDRRGTIGGTYDHIDPEGPNDPGNIVVSCRGCNARKGRRTPETAGMVLLPAPAKGPPPNGKGPTSNLPEIHQQPARNQPTGPDPTGPYRTGPTVSDETERARDVEREIFDYYRERIQPKARTFSRKKITARLEKFTEQELRQGIDNFAADWWRMENNASNGADWFFDSDRQVEKWVTLQPRPPKTNVLPFASRPPAPVSREEKLRKGIAHV